MMSLDTDIGFFPIGKENASNSVVTMNKENTEDVVGSLPLPRTPLSSIHNGQVHLSRSAKALRKARYSFVSPASTPQSPAGIKPSKRRVKCVSGGAISSQAELNAGLVRKQIPLNALVYKQVVNIIDDLKQEHESELAEKIAYIEQLEQQLKVTSNSSLRTSDQPLVRDFESELDTFAGKFVEQILQDAISDLEAETRCDGSTCASANSTSPQVTSETVEERLSIAEETPSFNHKSSGTTPCLPRVAHLRECASIATSPIAVVSTGTCTAQTMMTPRRLTDVTVNTDRVEAHEVSTSPIVILGSRTEHEREVAKLHKDREDYRELYYRSQHKLQAMETKLAAISELNHTFVRVKQSQMEIQTLVMLGYQKLSKHAREHEEGTSKVHLMYEDQLAEKQKVIEDITCQLSEANSARDAIEQRLGQQSTELLACQDQLSQTRDQTDRLEGQLSGLQTGHRTLQTEHSELETEHTALKSELTDLQGLIETAETLLAESSQQSQSLADSLVEKSQELENLHTVHAALNNDVQVLQQEKLAAVRAFETQEQEVTALTTERDKLAKLAGCQKVIIAALRQDIEKTATSREEDDFLEQELSAMKADLEQAQAKLTDKEAALSASRADFASCRQELSAAVADNHRLREQIQHLSSRSADIQSELDETKARAHFMLFQQNSELGECERTVGRLGVTLSQLHSEMLDCVASQREVLDSLQPAVTGSSSKEAPEEVSAESAVTEEKVCAAQSKKSGRRSFVCSILGAVNPENSETNKLDVLTEEQGTEDAPLAVRGESPVVEADRPAKPIIGAANSAFVRVQSSTDQDEQPLNLKRSDSSESSSTDNSLSNRSEDESSLGKQMDGVSSVVVKISETFKQLNKGLKETIRKHELELKHVRNQLSMEKEMNQAEQESLKSLLDQVTTNKLHLGNELARVRDQLSEKDAQLAARQTLVMDRTDKLEALAEELSDVKRGQRDYEALRRQLESREAELTAVRQTLDQRLAAVTGDDGDMITAGVRELVWKRRENAALESRLAEVEAEKEKVLQKCAKRMEIFKTNWDKAEKEVNRLDDLVERLRQALSYHAMTLNDCSRLQPLLRELGIKMSARKSGSRRVSDV